MLIKNKLDALLLFYLWLLPWSAVYIFDEKLWGGAKWQFGTGVIYLTELLLWLIFIFFAISLIKNGQPLTLEKIKRQFKRPDYKSVITLSLWLFLAYAGLSIFWSAEKSAGYYLWFHYLEAGLLFFIILLSNLDYKKVSWAWLLGGSVQAALAIWQFLNQQVTGNKFLGLVAQSPQRLGALVIETSDGRWLRSYGAFNDPNLLGGFLALGLMAGCWLYVQTEYKKLVLSLMAIMTAGLFFTFARGAFLALLIGLIIFVISQKINWSKILLPVAVIGLTLMALAIIFLPLVLSRINPTGRLEQKSIQDRSSQNQTALAMFWQHPLLGVGLNNYTYTLYRQNPELPAYQYPEVENIYLLLLAELGLIGLMLFLLVILTIGRLALKNKRYGSLAWLTALLILGCFYHYPLSQYPGLVLLLVSLTLAVKSDKFNHSKVL